MSRNEFIVPQYKIPINKDDLLNMYWKDGLSIHQIAKKIGVSSRTVANRFDDFGIKTRTISDALTIFKIDKDELYRLYWEDNLSSYEIGDMYGISCQTVTYHMKKFGIKRRLKSECNTVDIGIEDSDLYDMYINKEMTMDEIATKCGVSQKTIHRRIDSIGINKEIDTSANKGGRCSRYIDIGINKDELYNLYCVKNLTATQIGNRCGVSRNTITNRLDEYGIVHNLRRFKSRPEVIFEDICTKHNLPFHFVGYGTLWIGDTTKLNPDFIEANGKKIIVEIFGNYWHDPLLNPRIPITSTLEYRKCHFRKFGWESFFIWQHELESSNAEQFVLDMLEVFK